MNTLPYVIAFGDAFNGIVIYFDEEGKPFTSREAAEKEAEKIFGHEAHRYMIIPAYNLPPF